MKGNEQDIILTAMKKFPTQFIKAIKKSYTMLERRNGLRANVTSADVHMKELDVADMRKFLMH